MNKSVLLLFFTLGILFTTAAQAEDIPNQAYISGVVGHAQLYILSCEARSAADWAAYWGVEINETDFLNRLPLSDNPNEGFVGDPNDPWGNIPPASYGVHADPVANLLRAYGLDAHADTGLSWKELKTEVAAGHPVIVWVIGSIWAGTPRIYKTEDGQKVTVANNEHTMILIGYDENSVQLVDALTGYTVTHSVENFLSSWEVLGNMAITGEGSGQSQTDEQQAQNETAETENAYTVERGDTLNKVAARWDVSWEDLAAWNNISYPYTIYPGQELITAASLREEAADPAESGSANGETYTVQRGDYLTQIARQLDLEWQLLAETNGLIPPYLLYPSQVLQLPPTGDKKPSEENGDQPEVPEFYTATNGESLFALAHYYGMDWITLAGMNNLSFPYIIGPGQTIRLR